MAVLFLFVDGVGAGARDPQVNPLAREPFLLSRFADGAGTPLPQGGRAVLADACLGVPGRPQSATGQSTLFSGENAPRALGRHLLGFPNRQLSDWLRPRSIFRRLAVDGVAVAFANAFPVAHLRNLGLQAEGQPEWDWADVHPAMRRRSRASAAVIAFAEGQGRFHTWEDARGGRALTHDITGARANRMGAAIRDRSPEEGAEILARFTDRHGITLFEFFESDEAGHARSMVRALEVLRRFDRFLRALLERVVPRHSVVIASDHGNLEDLSSRNHTLAPVPVLGFGAASECLHRVRDLTHVAPLLCELARDG
jgi:2,3-bisphosphoglycerate-independent phosphoglycerate mutase